MAGKVWIRDYAEKVGASVEWNPVTRMVLIDGSYNIIPDEKKRMLTKGLLTLRFVILAIISLTKHLRLLNLLQK